MPTRQPLRWSLIVLGAASIGAASLGIVSCSPPSKPPPPIDDGVTVRVIVDGPGRIGSPPTFTCPGDCEWTLPANEAVAIIAFPATSNVFVAWDGPCDTLNATCSRVFQDGDVITARFAQHALRLDLTGDGDGFFAIRGPGVDVNCEADCGVALPELSFSIYAFKAGNTVLGAWGGACEGADRLDFCTVQVSGSTDVSKLWVHPPVAVDDPAYVVARGSTLVVPASAGVLANDQDTEGDTLTAQLVSRTGSGSLSLAANGGFTYTPDAGFSGEDTFTYRARDAFGNISNFATATITVVAVNRPPVANDITYTIAYGAELTVPAPGVLSNDTDPDGDPLTATLDTNVSNGVLELNADGSFTYTPDDGFSGDDTFTYTASDGQLTSTPATITITVNQINRPPVANDITYTIDYENELTVPAPGVLSNDTDPDGDPLTATRVVDVKYGELRLAADGSFKYEPDKGFSGDDKFTYTASDGQLTSTPATVTITVAEEDAPPP